MKILRKILSAVTLVSFLVTNIVYADGNTYKLAVYSKVSKGEFKEKAQLMLAMRSALLKASDENGLDLGNLSREKLISLGKVDFEEDSIDPFHLRGRISFDCTTEGVMPGELLGNISAEKDCLVIQAEVKGHIYYCLISKERQNGDFAMSLVSHKLMLESVKAGRTIFEHNMVSGNERAILDQYISHEISGKKGEAVDPWIARKINEGARFVDINAVPSDMKQYYQNKGWYYGQEMFVDAALKYLRAFGGDLEYGAVLEKELRNTPLVIIHYGDDPELPVINMDGQDIKVRGHSSEFATYVFIPDSMYRQLLTVFNMTECKEFYDYVLRTYVHEIGARCGLEVRVDANGVHNILDDNFEAYLSSPDTFNPSEAHRQIVKNIAPLNLVQLELRNDYAAGEAKDSKKKSIFKRAIVPLVIAILSVVGARLWLHNKTAEVKEQKQDNAETRRIVNFLAQSRIILNCSIALQESFLNNSEDERYDKRIDAVRTLDKFAWTKECEKMIMELGKMLADENTVNIDRKFFEGSRDRMNMLKEKKLQVMDKLKKMAQEDEDKAVRDAANEALEKINALSVEKKEAEKTGGDLIREVNDAVSYMVTETLWNHEKVDVGDKAANDRLNGSAELVLAGLGLLVYPAPDKKEEIGAVVERLRDPQVEIFMPMTQIDEGSFQNIKERLKTAFGATLRKYGTVDDLNGMIKNPEKSIVMATNLNEDDTAMAGLVQRFAGLRFMNFEAQNIDELKETKCYDKYMDETLVKLLAARAITRDDVDQKEASPCFRILAHLLAGDIGESEVEGYLKALTDIANNIKRILKNILKYDIEELDIKMKAVSAVWHSA